MIEKTLSTGEVVTAYPLAKPQVFLLGVTLKYGHGTPVNYICGGYYWKGGMDFDVMKKSMHEAIQRNECMRVRFVKDEKYKILQYIVDDTDLGIETVDFSDMTLEEAHKKASEMVHQRHPMFEHDLHMIRLAKFPEGYNGFFYKTEHICMDAYSTKVFIQDVMDIYCHYINGTPYPKPMRSYVKTIMNELAYDGSEQHKADHQYWHDSTAIKEPIFTDYMFENRLERERKIHPGVRYCDIHSGTPDAGPYASMQTFDYTAEETKKIMDTCEKNNITVSSMLALGVRTAVSIFNDKEKDVSIKYSVNRRGTLQQKKSGGMMMNYFPLRTIIEPEMTAKEATAEIEKVMEEIYAHSGLSFMEMLAARHESMPEGSLDDSTYDAVGLSYHPLMRVTAVSEEARKTAKTVWYNNGVSMLPFYITVRHRMSDEGFEFVSEYQIKPDPTYEVKVFNRVLHDVLMLCAENPDITVAELLEKADMTDEERNGKNK